MEITDFFLYVFENCNVDITLIKTYDIDNQYKAYVFLTLRISF